MTVIHNEVEPGGGSSGLTELAEALFCSPLRPEQRPDPAQIQAAVRASMRAHNDDVRLCACDLAQAYGDCPETTILRMRWCRDAVAEAYGLGAPFRTGGTDPLPMGPR